MNDIIISLNHHKIVEILEHTKKLFYYCSPGIHMEIANEIVSKANNIKDIKIIIDPLENNFRNGYGDIKAIDILKEKNISIYEQPYNIVSFFIADDMGYFLFPQSRIFSEQGIGNNAVLMDKVMMQQIKNFYFPPINQMEKQERSDELLDTFNEMKNDYKKMSDFILFSKPVSPIKRINEEKLKIVQNNLKINPPLNPDLKRQISTYKAEIQFVDMKFNGANIHSKKVSIPVDALPINDEVLKKELETKMNLFSDLKSNDKFRKFFQLKNEIEDLRKKFLISIRCREMSIIKLSDKESFKKEYEKLKEAVKDIKDSLPELLDLEAMDSLERVEKMLRDYLLKNPPEEINNYTKDTLTKKVDQITKKIISKINLKYPKNLIKDMSLDLNFFDLTFEDFKSEEFLKELKEKEILTQNDLDEIVRFKQVFEAKD